MFSLALIAFSASLECLNNAHCSSSGGLSGKLKSLLNHAITSEWKGLVNSLVENCEKPKIKLYVPKTVKM